MYLAEKTKKISFVKQSKAMWLSVRSVQKSKTEGQKWNKGNLEVCCLTDWNAKRYTESKRVYNNIRPLTYLSGQSCLFAILSTM